MSEPIKKGDLVVIVRGVCEHSNKQIGHVKTVLEITYETSYCGAPFCFASMPIQRHAIFGDFGVPLTWLKRIPPLSELESEKDVEEIGA